MWFEDSGIGTVYNLHSTLVITSFGEKSYVCCLKGLNLVLHNHGRSGAPCQDRRESETLQHAWSLNLWTRQSNEVHNTLF